MVNVLWLGENLVTSGDYSQAFKRLGHNLTVLEAKDPASCTHALQVLSEGNFDVVVLKNLRAMIEDTEFIAGAKHFLLTIAQSGKPIIVFDRVARNLPHRLGLRSWPSNIIVQEACTQLKENVRRLTSALRTSLSDASEQSRGPHQNSDFGRT